MASTETVRRKPSPALHLQFLDGLRGLAALFVLIHHAYAQVADTLPASVLRATHWLVYAQMAVDIFIVLSGYCLMLPVAATPDGRLRGGTWPFLKRRARRILPPYYAALAFALLLIAFVPGMGRPTGVFWDISLPAFTPAVLLGHLFLVHNFIPGTTMKIDYPMWTVAIEWNIYLLFPLLLLPVWRRFGVVALLAVALAVVGTAEVLEHHYHLIFAQTPWFLFLFALGMAGAVIGFQPGFRAATLGARLPWGGIAGALWLVYWVVAQVREPLLASHMWETDVYVGLAAVSLIVFCARRAGDSEDPASRPRILRLLETRAAVGLGAFSYSLYLVHAPLLALLRLALRADHLAPVPSLVILESVGVPACLLFAYGFSLLFERPFLRTRRRETPAELARDAALSPAP